MCERSGMRPRMHQDDAPQAASKKLGTMKNPSHRRRLRRCPFLFAPFLLGVQKKRGIISPTSSGHLPRPGRGASLIVSSFSTNNKKVP
jgi:hypothetical protein